MIGIREAAEQVADKIAEDDLDCYVRFEDVVLILQIAQGLRLIDPAIVKRDNYS